MCSYTFTSPPGRRGTSDAERGARRLAGYLDVMGHRLGVLEALVGAGFHVAGLPGGAASSLDPLAGENVGSRFVIPTKRDLLLRAA